MNIGIDIRGLSNKLTGIGRYTWCILDELQRADTTNNYYLFECRATPYAPKNPKWRKVCSDWKLPGTLWMLFVLPALLRKYKIDILWAPEQICPFFGVPPRTKIATTIHDFAIRLYPETAIASNRAIKSILIPAAIKKSAALLPVSEFTKNELFGLYPHSRPPQKIVKTVCSGAKDWGDKFKPVPRDKFLFCVGNLEPRKNHLRLLKALEIVHAAGLKIDLYLAGSPGWKNAELHKLINFGPLKDHIKFLGFITDDELVRLYLTCAAFIFPSTYEGFGTPVLEAFSLNTPVLTSKGSSMEEVAGDSAMYFDPYDTESIAATIIKFYKDGPPSISPECLGRYNWSRAAESMMEVFREMGNS